MLLNKEVDLRLLDFSLVKEVKLVGYKNVKDKYTNQKDNGVVFSTVDNILIPSLQSIERVLAGKIKEEHGPC